MVKKLFAKVIYVMVIFKEFLFQCVSETKISLGQFCRTSSNILYIR
jgi:hypothetical protein